MKNRIFARFARAFFIFWHFEDVLVLSTTSNDLFCSCVDDVSIWWQMFNFVFLCPKRWFQFNSRIVRTHFSNIMTLNNWKMTAETRSYIFRWRSRSGRRRGCLSSLILRININASAIVFFPNKNEKKKEILDKIEFRPNKFQKKMWGKWQESQPTNATYSCIRFFQYFWPIYCSIVLSLFSAMILNDSKFTNNNTNNNNTN